MGDSKGGRVVSPAAGLAVFVAFGGTFVPRGSFAVLCGAQQHSYVEMQGQEEIADPF